MPHLTMSRITTDIPVTCLITIAHGSLCRLATGGPPDMAGLGLHRTDELFVKHDNMLDGQVDNWCGA